MSRALLIALSVSSWLVLVGCSGSAPAPKSSDDAEGATTEESFDSTDPEAKEKAKKEQERRRAEKDDVDQADLKKEPPPERKNSELPDPKFAEGSSVLDAINAVPQGFDRENLEEEVMNRPLLDPSLYQPCKPGPTQHFTIKFALWGGRAVGMDITSTPKNAKLDECLREVVSRVKWTDKTRSLNISTVMF